MHDAHEYPVYPRHHVWYLNEQIEVGESRFSPIFDIDRGMGVSSTQAAPTGATASGDPDHLFRTIPIGTKILVHFAETGGVAFTAPTFALFGDCVESTNPITAVNLSGNLNIPVGGVLIVDSVAGFPYLQVKITNQDGENPVNICGAFRVLPT